MDNPLYINNEGYEFGEPVEILNLRGKIFIKEHPLVKPDEFVLVTQKMVNNAVERLMKQLQGYDLYEERKED